MGRRLCVPARSHLREVYNGRAAFLIGKSHQLWQENGGSNHNTIWEDFCGRFLQDPGSGSEKGYRGGEIRYAEFREPGEVVIYEECIKQAEQTFLDEELGSLAEAGFLREERIREVLLSHEIFHYLEYQEGDTAFTRAFRHKREGVVRCLPGAKVMCLSEIAAMAFVKTFQGLPFSPYVYDVFLVWGCNRDAAYAVYAAVSKGLSDLL